MKTKYPINVATLRAMCGRLGIELKAQTADDAFAEFNAITGSTYASSLAPVLDIHNGLSRELDNSKATAGTFRKQDVEPLLDQALILIDQALADRMHFDDIGERFARLALDLLESLKSIKVLLDEESGGRFVVAAAVSQSRVDGNSKRRKGLKGDDEDPKPNEQDNRNPSADSIRGLRKTLVDSVDPNAGGSVAVFRANCAAYVRAAYVPTSGYTVSDSELGQYTNRSWGHVDREVSQDQAAYDQAIQLQQASAASKDAESESHYLDDEAIGLKAQAAWDKNNKDYQKRRADIVSDVYAAKVQFATNNNFLDFYDQLPVINSRYLQSVCHAYLRLAQVDEGLKLYYPTGASSNPLPVLVDGSPREDVDRVVAWARNVSTWLAGFTRRCNNYVLTIPLSRSADWTKSNTRWRFTLEPAVFNKQSHVRVRGVCAWATSAGSHLWSLDITPPSATRIILENGQLRPSTGYATQEQSVCRVGKVGARERVVAPEISGLTSLFNLCPVGEWTVEIAPGSMTTAKPTDFEIDLYLSVLPAMD